MEILSESDRLSSPQNTNGAQLLIRALELLHASFIKLILKNSYENEIVSNNNKCEIDKTEFCNPFRPKIRGNINHVLNISTL